MTHSADLRLENLALEHHLIRSGVQPINLGLLRASLLPLVPQLKSAGAATPGEGQVEMDRLITKPRFLKKKEVSYLTSLAYASIDRLVKAGLFPKRRPLSDGRVGWVEEEVLEWIRKKIAA